MDVPFCSDSCWRIAVLRDTHHVLQSRDEQLPNVLARLSRSYRPEPVEQQGELRVRARCTAAANASADFLKLGARTSGIGPAFVGELGNASNRSTQSLADDYGALKDAMPSTQISNCSLSIRSSRLCSGSNSRLTVLSRDSKIATSTISRTSYESAVALTGRL